MRTSYSSSVLVVGRQTRLGQQEDLVGLLVLDRDIVDSGPAQMARLPGSVQGVVVQISALACSNSKSISLTRTVMAGSCTSW